jgi:putative ABC transport system permease protein
MAPAIRRVVREIDPLLPVFGVEALADTLVNSEAQRRFAMTLLLAFAATALLLALIGIHGVVSYWVAQRTHELGIRMALGAQRSQVVGLTLRQAAVLIFAGVALGIGGAAVLTRFLEAMLFGVTPLDPITFGGSALTFAVVALIASYLPARRAAKVDPMIALRQS